MKRLLLLLPLPCYHLAACGGSGFDDAILGAWEGISTVDGNANADDATGSSSRTAQ